RCSSRSVARLPPNIALDGYELGGSMQDLRERYRPSRLSLLFVGESPPIGGTFFYAGNSNLFNYTQQAFAQAIGTTVGHGRAFLDYFRRVGCYLEGLGVEPVNQLRGAPRRAMHRDGILPLSKRLSTWQDAPHAVLVVGKSVGGSVAVAADAAGWGRVPVSVL